MATDNERAFRRVEGLLCENWLGGEQGKALRYP